MKSDIPTVSTTCPADLDQLTAEDLRDNPRIFTIVRVSRGKGTGKGKGDQPMNVHLAEWPLPWRPCKTVRRLLGEVLGDKPADWPDSVQIELYCDPEIRFGADKIGGIRVRAMSHLPRAPYEHLATVTRGQRVRWTIQRLERTGHTVATTNDVQANLDRAVRLFGEINITLADLEMQIGSGRAKWGAAELEQLRASYRDRRKAAQEAEQRAEEEPNDQANDGELSPRDRLIDLLEQYANGQPLAAFLGDRFRVGKPVDKLPDDELRGFVKQLGEKGGAK